MVTPPPFPPDALFPEAPSDCTALLDALPWGVLVLNQDGIICRVNPMAARWCKAQPDALLGQSLAQAPLPPALATALERLLAAGDTPPDVWLPHARQWVSLRLGPAPAGQRWVFWEDVTDRHRAQATQQRSSQLLLDMESVAHMGSYEAGLTTGSFYFSDGLYHLFGEEPQSFEVTLEVIDARSHPDDAAAVRQVLDQAVATRQPYTYRRRIRRTDGQWRTLEAHGEVRCDAAGTPTGLRGLVQDVTERVQAEQALQQNQALLRRSIDSSLDLVQVFEAVRDEQGQVVDFTWVLNNAAAEQVYGNVIGQRLCQRNPGVIEEGIFDTFRQVLETGVPDQRERHYRHEQFDGWFYQSVVKLDDGVATTTRNITARKQAEQELRESKTLLQDVIDAPHIGIAVYRAVRNEAGAVVDFVHEYINRASRDMLGEDVTGRLFTEHGKNARVQLPHFREVLETGQRNSYVHEAQFRGRQMWFAITNTPLDGERLVHTWEDVTERQQAEAEILRLKDELARQATDNYHALLAATTQGFCRLQLLFDETGQHAVDFRYLEFNPAFVQHSGLPAEARGKTVRELVPDLEPRWFEVYGRVARTGQAERLEYHVDQLGRWFDAHAFRIGPAEARQVGVLFNDVTERKRRELNVALLAEVSHDLSVLSASDDIMQAVTKRVGAYLALSGCYFVDVDDIGGILTVNQGWSAAEVQSLKQSYRLDEYLTEEYRQSQRAGEVFIMRNTAQDERSNAESYASIQVGSFVTVPFLQEGKWVGHIAVTSREPREWRPDEIGLLQEITARVFPRIERARAEAALRASEEKYRTLFENIDEGFALYEVLLDERGQAVDILYHEANPAFARQSGARDVVGRKASELFPNTELPWMDTLTRVYQTGVGERMEDYHADTDRWFSLYYARVGSEGSPLIAVVFRDITERKRREANLAFIAGLMSDFAPLSTVEEVMELAGQRLTEHLQLVHCFCVAVDAEAGECTVLHHAHPAGLPTMTGTYPLATFHTEEDNQRLAAGQPMIVSDVDDGQRPAAQAAAYRAIGVRALVNTPYVAEGRWLFDLGVCRSEPGAWAPDDIGLLQEVAARVWLRLERARAEEALRESEAKYRTIFESIDESFCLQELVVNEHEQVVDLVYRETNGAFARHTGLADANGRKASELMPNLEQSWLDALTRVYQTGEPLHTEGYQAHLDRWFTMQCTRVGGPGSRRVAGVFNDITERKRHEQRQAFLLQLSDALRPLADPVAMQRAAMRVLGEFLAADRVYYVDIEPDYEHWVVADNYVREGVPPLIGRGRVEDFGWAGQELRAGRLVRIADAETDPNLSEAARAECRAVNLAALLAVPLLKEGRWVASFAAQHLTPRKWSGDDVALIQEAAERTWAAVERARAEAALHDAQERLQIAVEAAEMGTWYLDLTNDPSSYRSLRHDQIFGYDSSQSAWGQEIARHHVLEDDRAAFDAGFARALETGELQFEVRVRWADGSIHWMACHGRFYFDDQGRPVRGAGVNFDITARKQAEEGLRTSEAQLAQLNAQLEERVARRTQQLQENRDLLHAIAEALTFFVCAFKAVRDKQGRIVDLEYIFVNPAAEQVAGGRQLVGRRYSELFPEVESGGLLPSYRRVIETGERDDRELSYADGTLTGWFRSNATKLGDDGVLVIGEDITPRKRAEQERLRNLRLLEQAEAVAGLGSWDYELATGTLRWSEGMYHLFGLPVGSAVSPDYYLGAVLDENRDRAENLVRLLRAGEGFEETLRLRVAGEIKTVRLKAVALPDEAGQPARVLGVDLDISELQRLEADNLRLRLTQQLALFQAVQAAQEAERKRLAESLHNGIGQILYATKLRLDQLRAPLLGSAPALAAASAEADKLLSEAIHQTRALSHELVPMALEEFGLSAALHDIGRKMSTPHLHLRSHVELDQDAAPLTPALELALYRIAQELVQNIVKHAHGATAATLELETTPGWVLLRVEDNGAGFAPAATNRPGLGLRSIRDRVALLGGQLETGNAPTGGAYVRIRLPLPAQPPA
ncbi:PAS domain S-box protein [Hymenobacter latericus]|uniref:PAS domain S-box protein n=1 Tax=Hymenobacter sp. YIM 151858-1 TaxID=2987688 RepID=UPI002227C7F9|nr:PAS domain S-box protein [Hymenobacter sp. YIM 151858-1]UYZ59685.1 PAS domain S-box protein [Hymenobacter sp. YIM 151858-1]